MYTCTIGYNVNNIRLFLASFASTSCWQQDNVSLFSFFFVIVGVLYGIALYPIDCWICVYWLSTNIKRKKSQDIQNDGFAKWLIWFPAPVSFYTNNLFLSYIL